MQLFIDYKQVYDINDRKELSKAMKVLDILKKYVNLIKGFNNQPKKMLSERITRNVQDI